jgi:nitrogen fixation protein FixH
MIRWWMPLAGVVLLAATANAVLIATALRVRPGKVEPRPYAAEAGEDGRAAERSRFAAGGWRLTADADAGGAVLTLAGGPAPLRAEVALYRPDDPGADARIAWDDPARPLRVPLSRPGVWRLRLVAESADGTRLRHETSVYRP